MAYSDEDLLQIWRKAAPAPPPRDPSMWRLDAFHALINWSKYGKEVEYGGGVDHIVPPSRGDVTA